MTLLLIGNNSNNNNEKKKKNPHLNFLKGTVLGDKEQGVGIRNKGSGSRVDARYYHTDVILHLRQALDTEKLSGRCASVEPRNSVCRDKIIMSDMLRLRKKST